MATSRGESAFTFLPDVVLSLSHRYDFVSLSLSSFSAFTLDHCYQLLLAVAAPLLLVPPEEKAAPTWSSSTTTFLFPPQNSLRHAADSSSVSYVISTRSDGIVQWVALRTGFFRRFARRRKVLYYEIIKLLNLDSPSLHLVYIEVCRN